jgi:hypothetical protein
MAAVLIVASCGIACADDESDLLTVVSAGRRAAFDSVRTFSGEVTLEMGSGNLSPHLKGKYWRSETMVRIQVDKPEGTEDYYWGTDGEARLVANIRSSQTSRSELVVNRLSVNQVATALDVWRYMSLEWESYLKLAGNSANMKRKRVDGRNCVEAQLTWRPNDGVNSDITFLFDVDQNYHVWRRVMTTGDWREEQEITQFAEPKPGILFPVELRGIALKAGKRQSQCRLGLNAIRVNEPLAKALLQPPPLPHGTELTDWILGETYQVDQSWRKIPGTTKRKFDTNPVPALSHGEYGTTSTEEAQSWTRWLIPASTALLVVTGLLWVYRLYRGRPLRPSEC